MPRTKITRDIDIAWQLIRKEKDLYSNSCVDSKIASQADANWYNEHGVFALVIEIIDEDGLRADGMLQTYKNSIGFRGGLAPEFYSYRRGIIVNIEGYGGYYLASNLHINNHYFIHSYDRLKRYLEDAVKFEYDLHVLSHDERSAAWNGERYVLPKVPGVVIITPGNTTVIVDSAVTESVNDGEISEADTFIFMNISDVKMTEELRNQQNALNHDSALNMLCANKLFEQTEGSISRKQSRAMNFQYCPLNSTDNLHPLCAETGRCAPKLTSKYDGISFGWSGGRISLVDDIKLNMFRLTQIADSMVKAGNLKLRVFNDHHTVQQFASKIYPENRLTGYTGTATLVDGEHELCTHIDQNNSRRRECNQVVGSYQYMAKINDTNGESRLFRSYCGGRSMRACDKMANDGANIERLYEDLIQFTQWLPDHRISFPPRCDDKLRRFSLWSPNVGVVTGVHIHRSVFW